MQDSDPLDQLRRYASALISAAEEPGMVPDLPATTRPVKTARPPFWARPRMAAATAFFLLANVGLAAAADHAVPGDLLYPVDLGYEALTRAVGVDTGGAAERVEEAYVLLAQGRAEAAIRTASKALPHAMPEERAVLEILAEQLKQGSAVQRRADLHAVIGALIETVQSAWLADGDDSDITKGDDIKRHARVVAETARGKPFAPDQGPGKEESVQDPVLPADSSTDSSPNDDAPGQGNGRENAPGQGNGQGNVKP